jgi:hypothetical protein
MREGEREREREHEGERGKGDASEKGGGTRHLLSKPGFVRAFSRDASLPTSGSRGRGGGVAMSADGLTGRRARTSATRNVKGARSAPVETPA